MEEFDANSKLGIFRAKFRHMESGMAEFEYSSKLGIGNEGVEPSSDA